MNTSQHNGYESNPKREKKLREKKQIQLLKDKNNERAVRLRQRQNESDFKWIPNFQKYHKKKQKTPTNPTEKTEQNK